VGLKAQALHLGDRRYEAFEAISEAEAPAEEFEQLACRAELHRLRGVVLKALGARTDGILLANDVANHAMLRDFGSDLVWVL
jgi:hypothetical protein